MEPVWIWIIFSFIGGAIAHRKGNKFLSAFVVSLLLSPLIGIIVALAMAKNDAALEERKVKSGTHKRCPACRELIRRDARVCRFCRQSFDRGQQEQVQANHSVEPKIAPLAHLISGGRCTECGCSVGAIKKFGYDCTPRKPKEPSPEVDARSKEWHPRNFLPPMP